LVGRGGFNVGSGGGGGRKDKQQDPPVEHDLYVSLDDICKVNITNITADV